MGADEERAAAKRVDCTCPPDLVTWLLATDEPIEQKGRDAGRRLEEEGGASPRRNRGVR